MLPLVQQAALYGSIALLALYAAVCCVPAWHATTRKYLRPLVLKRVEAGIPAVQWAQSWRHPFLTLMFNTCAHTVSVPFYASMLPLLFWFEGHGTGWRLTLLLTLTLYVGNSLKDLFCAPRPFSVAMAKGQEGCGTTLLAQANSEDFQLHAKEYGLPSSHTMNTLVFAFYLAHRFVALLSPPLEAVAAAYAAATVWLALVAASRLYLGFHTPVDIAVGAVYGGAMAVLFAYADGALGQWIVTRQAGLHALLVLVVLLRLHPTPLTYTPSFEYTVSFAGVGFGIAAGMHKGAQYVPYLMTYPSPLSAWGLLFALRRTVAGFVVVAIIKGACKGSLLWLLPPSYRCFPLALRRLWQLPMLTMCQCRDTPHCTHRDVAVNAKGHPWDADCTARFFAYASIGWTAVHLAPRLFATLGW